MLYMCISLLHSVRALMKYVRTAKDKMANKAAILPQKKRSL